MLPISHKSKIRGKNDFVISRLRINSLKLRKETPHGGDLDNIIPGNLQIITRFSGWKQLGDQLNRPKLAETHITNLFRNIDSDEGPYHHDESEHIPGILKPTLSGRFKKPTIT